MRPITITLAVIMLSIAGTALGGEEHEVFDQVLAAEPGADEYGMRRCVMAFLKAGPDRDRPGRPDRQAGHGIAPLVRVGCADEGQRIPSPHRPAIALTGDSGLSARLATSAAVAAIRSGRGFP